MSPAVNPISIEDAFACNACDEVVNTSAKLKYHQKKFHQPTVTVRFSDGGECALHRSDNGQFKCPCGSYENALPQSIQGHCASHERPVSSGSPIQVQYEDVVSPAPNTTESLADDGMKTTN